MAEQPPADRPDSRTVTQLVEDIVDDARELVNAHVDALREDIGGRFATLGATLAATLVAFSMAIVTGLLVGIALALTLVALGLPAWAAFWIVAAATGLAGFALVRRMQRTARNTGRAASEAVDGLERDIAWISEHASEADTPRTATQRKSA